MYNISQDTNHFEIIILNRYHKMRNELCPAKNNLRTKPSTFQLGFMTLCFLWTKSPDRVAMMKYYYAENKFHGLTSFYDVAMNTYIDLLRFWRDEYLIFRNDTMWLLYWLEYKWNYRIKYIEKYRLLKIIGMNMMFCNEKQFFFNNHVNGLILIIYLNDDPPCWVVSWVLFYPFS